MNLWDWEPSVVAGCIALAACYLVILRRDERRGAPVFLAGVALLLLDLVSPIDALGDRYLFSAHVLQHFLLALVIPPLLLLGTPGRVFGDALQKSWCAGMERAVGQPPVSWALGVGTMLAWHVPVVFNAALANETIHILQHLSFLVTGTIFWWPILAPLAERRLPALAAVCYLFSACACCSLLGAFLTFAPAGLYPAYLHPEIQFWGLDPKSDQQLGGLLMWVPGCFVYLAGILVTIRRWYGTVDAPQTHSR